MAGSTAGPRNKDGSYKNPEDLAAYQQSWNQANGANAAYSQAMAAGKPAGGSVELLQAPPGWTSGGTSSSGGALNTDALMKAFQGLSGGGTSSSSAPLPPLSTISSTNTAAANPDLQKLQAMYSDRYNQLQAGNKPNDELTKRMMNLAGGKINDSAAGAQQQLSENLARRGVAGGGVETDLRGRVGESAQRAAAGAKANIAVGRAGQEEQASLQRDSNLNNFLLGGSTIAGATSQLQLQNQELALRQYQIQQQAELNRRSEAANAFSNLVGLFR